MKNFNSSCSTISYHVEETNPNLINQEVIRTFFKSPVMQDIIKDGINILDLFAAGRFIYDAIPQNMDCMYFPLDITSDMRYKEDMRVLPIESSDINKIKMDDKSCDVIFAPASKIAYGKFHQSMFEIERIIKQGGHLICDQSKFWYNRQFNAMLFCNREWDLIKAVEVNYIYKGSEGANPTARYYLIYRKR